MSPLIFFIVIPIITLFIIIQYYGETPSLFSSFFISSILGFFIGFLLFGFVSHIITSDIKPSKEIIISSYPLVNLQSSDELNGKYSSVFFVGSGYINEVKFYVFYKVLKSGDIKYEKVRASDYLLNFSDKPKIITYGKKYNEEERKNIWLLENDKNKIYESRKVLYIPEGTLKTNFKID